ncbi:membrane associated rhomboid family serine protease [Rhizobium skierniewicense]|uniref:Membrane associated rhomboid family serine protease n=1 Tax=Rhizobium skierniewicense TaxID=984260 RepID=A0A7W6C8F1_9HYPH|nr:rhomboid family intramembrane serine protease [Rhizobium skierniewicense]MBB3947590.1 membrane associated rhomboid family serine protease [Rhizobium skierniewicense]NTF32203.1 rhomboid family intramembrane serine protease [Rhizobium skierniewicense]
MTHHDTGPSETDEVHQPAPPQKTPVFNLPGVLVAILGVLIAVHVISTYLLSEDAYGWFLYTFGFIPLRYAVPLSQQGLEWLWTPITYSFLHGGIEHILFNGLWLMAFGAPVLRRIGTLRFILLWCVSSAVAAFGHAFLNWGDVTVLIGASGVVSALMGAACRFAFPANGGRYHPAIGHRLPRQGIVEALTNRTVLIFTLMWLFGNVLIAVGIPLFGDVGGEVAWDAHIFGFLLGFLFFALFDRKDAVRA